MNRRAFVSRVTLGGVAAACTGFGRPAQAAPASKQVNVRFVGMMTFVERADRSFLVATPGRHHAPHDARAVPDGTRGLADREGVRAWRRSPASSRRRSTPRSRARSPADFVYRNLEQHRARDHVRIGGRGRQRSQRDGAVATASRRASACAATSRSGPRQRSRCVAAGSKTRRPSGCRQGVVVRNYQQRLTDAVNYRNIDGATTTIRLTQRTDVRSVTIGAERSRELWVISAARSGQPDERARPCSITASCCSTTSSTPRR